jgi:hypothetical protein
VSPWIYWGKREACGAGGHAVCQLTASYEYLDIETNPASPPPLGRYTTSARVGTAGICRLGYRLRRRTR